MIGPAPRPEWVPPSATFLDLRIEIENQLSRYEFRRRINSAENPSCHTLTMLDRCIAIYRALDRLVERVSGDAFILERLREIAAAEQAERDG